MGDSQDMFRICIFLLSLAFLAQALEETDNRCKEGKECIHRDGCPSWSKKRAQLNSLEKSSKQYKDLLAGLLEEVCNRSEKGVCCSPSLDKQQLPSTQDSSKLPPIGECGKPRESVHHIVGGEDTPLGEFPFTALLGTNNASICSQATKASPCWICGDTLINARYILTAAHCVPGVTKVRLGEHKVTRIPGKDCLRGGINCLPEVQDFDVSEKDIITHPDYKNGRGQVLNDIALIRLPRPATFNAGVQPACLPTAPELASDNLNVPDLDEGLTGTRPVVVGWGHTNPFRLDKEDFVNVGVPKAIQQMLEVHVLSSSECGKLFLTPEKSQICAGGDRGKDSCRGDSGGPLLLRRVLLNGLMDPNNDHDDPWFLLGVVSFGTRVCGRGKPGIYTRVETFVPWILQNIY